MTSASAITRLPEDQRPRERMLVHGPGALSDAELIALLLGTGRAGVNAIDLATRLLQAHGGISGLRRADVTTLAREKGIGAAKATRLVAALALATRAIEAVDLRPVIGRSSDIARIVSRRFADVRRERIVLVVCGAGSRVLDVIILSDGAAHTAAFPLRELLAEVLRRDGVAFGLAHNHPGGDLTPSEADRRTTAVVQEAAARVGLRLLDHIVVAGDEWRSVTGTA